MSGEITGLAPNTTYHFRVSATNAGGTSKGSDETFKTLPNAPTVVTKAAIVGRPDDGDAERDGQPQRRRSQRMQIRIRHHRSLRIERLRAPPRRGPGKAPWRCPATSPASTANTTYHFRISATNAGGTSKGSDETFKTLPNAPTVVTKAATSVAQTTATLNATVNPNGGDVSECKFEYGTTT